MSVSKWIERARSFNSSISKIIGGDSGRWAAFGFSGKNDPRRANALVPLLIVGLVTALGVAALRIDLIRTRYAVAASMEAEKSLIEEQRTLIARKRQLRDPTILAVEARKRGFRPPTHIFSIPDPTALGATLPDVAARPQGIETQ